MAEKTGGGERVGSIYYEVTLDTQKLIEDQRKVVSSIGEIGTKMTQTAQAAKAFGHEAGMASKYTKEFEAQAKKLGMTAGELKAATRVLPAQFTDIAVSLASGQNPMTVFLQQGGQLKDMFGGIGPAARAMAGYIAGLVNPFTAAAAVIGVLIYGLVKGNQEFQEFNKILVLSGNRAGTTADHLMSLSAALDNMAGVTRGQAAEALNAFISLGVSGSEHLQRFTAAALDLERAGGPAVKETAKAFSELEKKPLEASIKLQAATGFLTKEIYAQIKALSDAGKTTEAARVAQEAYASAINIRTPEITKHLGAIERAWLAIKSAASETGDAILSVGRQESKEDRLTRLKANRDSTRIRPNYLENRGVKNEIEALELAIAEERKFARQQADRVKETDKAVAQDKTRAEFAERYASNQEKARKEIEEARKAGILTPELEGKINAKYKEKSRFDPAVYLEDLRGKASNTDSARAESEAAEASKRNQKLLADGLLTRGQAAAAEILIEERKQNTLAEIGRKNAEKTNELRIAIMKDGEEKIDATRKESIRKINEAERAGLHTAEQATLARQQAEAVAARAREELAERNARAVAEKNISLAKDEAERIRLIRDETIRQAQDGYRRGTLTAAEEASKRVEAERVAEEQIRQLKQKRDTAKIQTLQMQAGSPTATSEDKIALLRAQADLEFQANEEARARDLAGAKVYADQRMAIERKLAAEITSVKQAEQLAIINSSEQAFGALAGILKTAGREQSTAYKVMFAASKAFAIAESIIKIQQGIASAAALPFPINIPAMASVVAATAGIVSTIQGVQYGGGRQYGGAVSADKMYRVNETGQPEMFTASNGRQYMMPNTRGEVTPANKVGGGNVQVSVNVVNNHSGAGISVNQRDDGRVVEITINEIANQINNNSGPVWNAMRSSTNIEGRM